MPKTWVSLLGAALLAGAWGCGSVETAAHSSQVVQDLDGDGEAGTCADVLFGSFDQCLIDAGVDIEDPSEEAQAIIASCWIDVANGDFDACCAASPDETCDVGDGDDGGGDDGDGGDGDDGGDGGDGGDGDGGGDQSCATILFAANSQCLADAGSEWGDLDGSGEIDTEEELALVSGCWIDVANGAFDACCAATPDQTCDVGDGDDEPAPEPGA